MYSLLPPQDQESEEGNAKELEGDELDAKDFESVIEDMSEDEMKTRKKKGVSSKKKAGSKKEKASKPNKEVMKVRFRENCVHDS